MGCQCNIALVSAVRRGRGLKEIHIEIFPPVLPCPAPGKSQEGSGLWDVTFLRLPGARAVEEVSLTVPRECTGGNVATYCRRERD